MPKNKTTKSNTGSDNKKTSKSNIKSDNTKIKSDNAKKTSVDPIAQETATHEAPAESTGKPSAEGSKLRLWLIILFAVMIVSWSLSFFLTNPDAVTYTAQEISVEIIGAISTIIVFVLSILHLIRYKEKGFAIIALVISGLLVLMLIVSFVIGFIYGVMQSLQSGA